ncbi:hypothetical protein [Qingshengfaniella alkalisoli]|uniref:Uncharacterized protein n=1 Tax=Qingshengfaniella alkalisoli TaxID=2599296 RepID=A0A5B8I8G4_9RHOB|nr:hypothetical protein [Qingshengfaniella alkalisoli]QDY70059.1 hypothetical protein FPZ52_10815 [Qingshengfaniella alkalisoli]
MTYAIFALDGSRQVFREAEVATAVEAEAQLTSWRQETDKIERAILVDKHTGDILRNWDF